ncbi:MAG: type III-B CRISPR module RAMP protein Cmr4 [Verrucomicrobia bacterium]|nr:type III-B CRISPR module RAMP protein Cmr4 [Verrucomicrobiota bacterium]
MTDNMKRHLLTLYTRTPLHVGSGTSVDVVDLPIVRERITGFPVIPASSLKGVLLQAAREKWGDPRAKFPPPEARLLFGTAEEDELDASGQPVKDADGKVKKLIYAGCVQIMEAKILAFPVRSLAGCFAWLTCPSILERFQRDTGRKFTIPTLDEDRVVPGTDLIVGAQVVLEEYALEIQRTNNAERRLDPAGADKDLLKGLGGLTNDPLWTGKLVARLAIVHDENFQHFVTTCTEVVARIKIDPARRTVDGGALFNQENVPCEALFYSVLTVLPPRRNTGETDPAKALDDANTKLMDLLPDGKDLDQQPPILQIGGDETTGHGLCETKREELP